MYHLRLKGDYYQMGVKRGNIFQKAHISFPLQLDDFQLEHGKRSEEILRKFFPEICEEVRGVSDTIGTDYLHFISWMLCMGCCMYNLENNIPVEVRGCTAFATTPLQPLTSTADSTITAAITPDNIRLFILFFPLFFMCSSFLHNSISFPSTSVIPVYNPYFPLLPI